MRAVLWEWLKWANCMPMFTNHSDEVTESELFTTLSDISIEARYRKSVERENSLHELDAKAMSCIHLLCKKHFWLPSALAAHFLEKSWYIWLYAVPVAKGYISLNPVTKFQKHNALRVYIGGEESYMDRLVSEGLTLESNAEAMSDVGFDQLE